MTISFQNHELYLLPEKAIWWPAKKALLIADLHFGKIEHFRMQGIPLPNDARLKTLDILTSVIEKYQPTTVYFLGDLFHSQFNTSVPVLKGFFNDYNLIDWILIKGNHDILDENLYELLNISVFKDLIVEDFILTHEPLSKELNDYLNICGHIHPAIRIKGRGKQYLTLPCFYKRGLQMILPAFGFFTGTAQVQNSDGTKIYAVGDNQVFEIPYIK